MNFDNTKDESLLFYYESDSAASRCRHSGWRALSFDRRVGETVCRQAWRRNEPAAIAVYANRLATLTTTLPPRSATEHRRLYDRRPITRAKNRRPCLLRIHNSDTETRTPHGERSCRSCDHRRQGLPALPNEIKERSERGKRSIGGVINPKT